MSEAPPFTSQRFEIKQRLGEGGMGVVYEAFDRERDVPVAIKTIRNHDPQLLYRLKNEFRAVQGLEHPNLVRLDELHEEDGAWFISMELIRGVDILRYVRKLGAAPDSSLISVSEDTMVNESLRLQPSTPAETPYDEPRLRASFGQLALGLSAIHVAGMIHRDIKPPNVLVDEEGRVAVLDFGLIFNTNEAPSSDNVVGTMEYMAPEQALAKQAEPPADWYGFGVVLYEALTGRLPHTGNTGLEVLIKKQRYEPPPPRALFRHAPVDLDALCQELLRIDPDKRPQGQEVLERLGIDINPRTSEAPVSSVFTQRTPFVGRVAELRALRDAFEATDGGAPVTLMITGESGTGKSELARQAIEQCTYGKPGSVVFAGRCYERETVPYKGFDGVADALSRFLVSLPEREVANLLPMRAGLLPRLFPVLSRVGAIAAAATTLPEREGPSPHVIRARMFASLRGLFHRLTETHRVIIFIDDLQWTDGDSLALIEELLSPPNAPPLLLLATARPESERLQTTKFPGDVRHVELHGLSSDDTQLLVKAMAPMLVARNDTVAQIIAEESAGHPLFVQELVRHLEAAGPSAPTTRLDDALWARVYELPADVRGLIEMLAVAGVPITHQVASTALELDREHYERIVAVLRVAFLARTTGLRSANFIEPYHNRVRESVLANIDTTLRRQHHARLAIALEQAGAATDDPQALVEHLEGAGELDRAAHHAREAAARAATALAFDRAAELYRAALRLGSFDAESARPIRIELGYALVHAGRGAEAAVDFLAAAEGADATTWLECKRQAAEQLIVTGYIDRGLSALEELAAEVRIPIRATAWRTLSSMLMYRARLSVRGLGWTERHRRAIPDSELAQLETYKVVSQAFSMVDTIRGLDLHSQGLLLALNTGEREHIARFLAHEVVFLASQNGRARIKARKLLDHAKDMAGSADSAYLTAWLALAEGLLRYFAGEFEAALPFLVRCSAEFRDNTSGTSLELGTSRVFRTFCLIRKGAFRELGEISAPYIRDAQARGDRYAESSMRRSSGMLWLARDQPDVGRRDLEESPWTPPSQGFHLQHWYELEARGELAIYEGRAATAIDTLEPDFARLGGSMLLRIQIVRALALSLRSRLLIAACQESGTGDAGGGKLKRLLRRLAKDDVCYATTPRLLLGAAVASQLGNQDQAVELLRRTIKSAPDQAYHKTVAERRLGQLLGGDEGAELIAKSDEWMRSEGVMDAERMTQVAAPGFPDK